ncbi:MAG TPA: DUF1579 family protein [Longimicrobium sp.]|nr:DUF1579 family protein [Longimicrobium sp.]
MSAPEILEPLLGSWTGTSTLFRPWMTPAESDSPSTATVERVVGGKFAALTYTWEIDGAPQEGMILLGQGKGGEVTAAWGDSWHMNPKLMFSTGSAGEGGAISVLGSYEAPPGPDWGWRTEIRTVEGGFEIVMHNISPDGEESIAVRNRYSRSS